MSPVPKAKLWCVVSDDASEGLLEKYDTEEQAVHRRNTANASAAALGIATRYKVIERGDTE